MSDTQTLPPVFVRHYARELSHGVNRHTDYFTVMLDKAFTPAYSPTLVSETININIVSIAIVYKFRSNEITGIELMPRDEESARRIAIHALELRKMERER